MGPYGLIWPHMGPIWPHMGPIWTHMGPIWAHMGPIWAHMGPIWTHMDLSTLDRLYNLKPYLLHFGYSHLHPHHSPLRQKGEPTHTHRGEGGSPPIPTSRRGGEGEPTHSHRGGGGDKYHDHCLGGEGEFKP